jgi:uncharacterized protein (TIGR04255 family)
MTAIVESYDRNDGLKAFLPAKRSIPMITLMVGQQQAPTQASVGGWDFSQHKSDASVAWSLSIRRELISCSCAIYDRWQNVKPTAMQLLEPFLTAIVGQGVGIQAIGLQYQDSFSVTAATASSALTAVLDKNSRWLPRILCEHESLWHVYQGWFSRGVSSRRVHNTFNIDIQQHDHRNYQLRVHGQHRLLSVDFDGISPATIQVSDVDHALDMLHQLNKKTLAELLNRNVQDQICLNYKEAE